MKTVHEKNQIGKSGKGEVFWSNVEKIRLAIQEVNLTDDQIALVKYANKTIFLDQADQNRTAIYNLIDSLSDAMRIPNLDDCSDFFEILNMFIAALETDPINLDKIDIVSESDLNNDDQTVSLRVKR